jgi:Mrp family chromosome partitioning ATPase/predicted Fe-Mo cluster-binding NifX family protein
MAQRSGCQGGSAHGDQDQKNEAAGINEALKRIGHKIVVLSGKGGVGKSTVAVNLAVSLCSMAGYRVGLMDVDIHGPSIPKMLGLDGAIMQPSERGKLIPVDIGGLKVMSIGFLLPGEADAVIWRGPAKASAIKQFIGEVEWGDLDYLIVDCPPGTGDEPLTVVQTLEKIDGAVVVTTPQDVALADVRKSISFCGQLNLPILGVIENMSGLVCPHCAETIDVFKTGGGEAMAREMMVPFLGRVPMDPKVVVAGDDGMPYSYHYANTAAGKAFGDIVTKILDKTIPMNEKKEIKAMMRVAIPVCEGVLSMHFGHCEKFAMVDVDEGLKAIVGTTSVEAPPHEPGLLPGWLAERGVNLVIAGGMGGRAQQLFTEAGVKVIVGATSAEPESVVRDYLAGNLVTGANVCDH